MGEMSRFARHDINRFTSPRASAASVAVSRKIVGEAVGRCLASLDMTLISVYVTASERSERGGLPQNR
ncbi:MAG: hypothetical protein KatS3mg045_1528 [Bellilinea sp.]|nr:MAG: hypothetical protein KatS3mg045_1528 [Bellilinea sp.]